MSSITVPIPDELRRQIERLSQRQGRVLSDLVIESIRMYLAAE